MTGKTKLYIGLLALGVVLIGGGLWLLFHPAPAVDAPEGTPAISEKTSYSHLIPDSTPIISANISHVMRGEFNLLSIYEDGEIIYIEEKGLRMPSPEYPPTRIWRTGQISSEELSSLINFFRDNHFDELNDHYKFPGIPVEGSGTGFGDMDGTISIDYQDLHKTVRAAQYISHDDGMTYPDMPYPLNEIYRKLRDIAVNRTAEVARESIKASLLWK